MFGWLILTGAILQTRTLYSLLKDYYTIINTIDLFAFLLHLYLYFPHIISQPKQHNSEMNHTDAMCRYL